MESMSNLDNGFFGDAGNTEGSQLPTDSVPNRINNTSENVVFRRGLTKSRNVIQPLTRREVTASGVGSELLQTMSILIGPTLESVICGVSAPVGEEEGGRRAATAFQLPSALPSRPLSVWNVTSGVASSSVYHDALKILLSGPNRFSYIHDTSESNSLRLSCKNGNAVGIQCLLNAGMDPNNVGEEGINGLHILLRYAHTFRHFDLRELKPRMLAECVSMLLEAGANPAALDDIYGTPLHIAARGGYVSVTEVLLTSPKYVRYVNDPVADDSCPNNGHRLTLDVNARDKNGITPLHNAKNEGVTQLLITHGAHVNIQDDKGRSPLHVAVSKGRIDVVRVLISNGADVNAVDGFGGTCLQRAARKDLDKLTLLLLNAGANVHGSVTQELPALHTAAKCCSLSVARVLISSGADVNAVDNTGCTPLHYASDGCSFVNNEATPLLRHWRGARMIVEARNNWEKRVEMVNLLISSGADVHARNASLETPIKIAVSRSDRAVEEALLASGAVVDDF